MILFALLALQTPVKDEIPMDVLGQVIKHYRGLKSLSYTLVRSGPDGTDKNANAERVYWKAPTHFEISSVPYGQNPAAHSPKLIGEAAEVTALPEGAAPNSTPLFPGPDTIGSWEVRGGLPLVWLMSGKSWDLMSTPTTGGARLTFGAATSWHGHPVKQIILMQVGSIAGIQTSFYVSPKYDALIGMDAAIAKHTEWTEYVDAKEEA